MKNRADVVAVILFYFLLVCVILSGKQDILTDKNIEGTWFENEDSDKIINIIYKDDIQHQQR